MVDKKIYKRILDIAYKHKCSHLGSYFSSVDIIDYIFTKKNRSVLKRKNKM